MSIASGAMGDTPLSGQLAGAGRSSSKRKAPATRSLVAKPDSGAQPEPR